MNPERPRGVGHGNEVGVGGPGVAGRFDYYERPDPDIYCRVAKALALTPDQHLFVDDYPDYVEGAGQAGLNAIEFTDSTHLVQELAAHGIDASSG